MKLLERWWGRLLIYVLVVAAVAWTAYHAAYRHSCGARCSDSSADLAIFDGLVAAAGTGAIALFVCAAMEGALLWRRRSR